VTKSNIYVALLADVVGSRRLPPAPRAALQHDLRAALPQANRRWRRALAARFALARGDEIEGLLRDPGAVWDIAHWLRARLPQVDWIIACGRGPIATALAPSALEVDGPCFHLARTALEAAKRDRRLFAFAGFGGHVDALARYYSALYWSWTPRQRRAANQLRAAAGAPLEQTGERLHVHPTAVSHMKRRLAWPLVAAGDTLFQATLQETT